MIVIPKSVVFIQYKISIVIKGLEKRLQTGGYETEHLTENFERIRDLAPDTGVFVLYRPEEIIESEAGRQKLVLLSDQIKDNNCVLVIIGDEREKGSIAKVFPGLDQYRWVERPINPEKFFTIIEDVIQKETERRLRESERRARIESQASEMSKLHAAVKKNAEEKEKKKRILIIDDDPSFAGMVRSWIKDQYRADIVTAGMKAITFLMKNSVDLILLDYEMPVVDGPQVLQMLRQEESTASIPVIFLTGVSSMEGVKRVMGLKPAGYILKSSPRDELLKMIKSHIG